MYIESYAMEFLVVLMAIFIVNQVFLVGLTK